MNFAILRIFLNCFITLIFINCIHDCVTLNIFIIFLLCFRTLLLAGQLLEIINDPTIKYLGQNSDLLPMMEFFLNAYLSQQESMYHMHGFFVTKQ